MFLVIKNHIHLVTTINLLINIVEYMFQLLRTVSMCLRIRKSMFAWCFIMCEEILQALPRLNAMLFFDIFSA